MKREGGKSMSYYASNLRKLADGKMVYGMNTPESLELKIAATYIERLEDLLREMVKAIESADAMAHQLLHLEHPSLLDAYWLARGGHDKCTVCISNSE
jgi:hypothetical protein